DAVRRRAPVGPVVRAGEVRGDLSALPLVFCSGLGILRGMTGSPTTTGIAITGTGVWTPEHVITNDELVAAFNEYVRRENARNAEAIAAGTREALKDSSTEFILKAS